MRKELTAFVAELEAFAVAEGLDEEWRYLNYVDGTQDPLRSYGAENVGFMREVARRYDPQGVFQEKVVSGWKVSRVEAQP